jgi:hypothetical protein
MLEDTVFSVANAGLPQILGFLVYAGCTVGFILYIGWIVRE